VLRLDNTHSLTQMAYSAILITLKQEKKGNRMKPIWHIGSWTDRNTEDLQEELLLAQQTRSLTGEERLWLLAVDTPETLLEAQE